MVVAGGPTGAVAETAGGGGGRLWRRRRLSVVAADAGGVLICASSSYDALDMQLRDDARIILDKYGFDRPLLKYYWRRAMVEDVPVRVVPGGPDGHHH
ncbi:hypothetical protein R6Q57_028801 [Mikania cordata]